MCARIKSTEVDKQTRLKKLEPIAIGIDVAKDSHWVTAVNQSGEILLKERVLNAPDDIHLLTKKLKKLKGDRCTGIDMVGGIATLVTLMLNEAGETVVHVPGRSVNRARTGLRGGEHKSDPTDALVIAEQVRTRRSDLRVMSLEDDVSASIRFLVTRRRTITVDQVRLTGRLHELLAAVNAGLEQKIKIKGRTSGYLLLSKFVTPKEIRDAGVEGIVAFLRSWERKLPNARKAAELAVKASQAQKTAIPGERIAAQHVKDMARQALENRAMINEIDEALVKELADHPDTTLIQSLPGMGVVLTAEFIAHAGNVVRYRNEGHLAAAAGLAPVLRQTGRTSFLTKPLGGNKNLKRACYQAAMVAIKYHLPSRIYYDRKRREGKSHRQAMIALARKRIGVLYALLKNRGTYLSPEVPMGLYTKTPRGGFKLITVRDAA